MKTCIRWFALLALVLLLSAPVSAQEKPGRVAVAKLVTETGSVLRREAEGKTYKIVKKGEELFTGDLLIGLPGAILETKNGAYRVTFKADVSKKSPLPILESAIVLRQKQGLDLDFFLDRGRVDVTSLLDKSAKFTFGWQGQNPCVFDTEKKGTSVVVETYSRWAPGVVFDPNAKKEQKPLTELVFLVTSGELIAYTKEAEAALKAPPGAALFSTSTVGGDNAPRYLETLPDWLIEDDSKPEVQAARKRLEEFRQLMVDKGIPAALDTFLASDDLGKKRLALIALCAQDDLARLGQTFRSSKSPEVLELCIVVLRHWLARDAKHDEVLFKALTADPNIPPAQATTTLQLLHTFTEKELAEAETYEVLVGYLRHKALGIRALAHYHLVRAYPDGKAFGFNPAGSDEERAAAVAKWREVLTSGKLPPKPQK